MPPPAFEIFSIADNKVQLIANVEVAACITSGAFPNNRSSLNVCHELSLNEAAYLS